VTVAVYPVKYAPLMKHSPQKAGAGGVAAKSHSD